MRREHILTMRSERKGTIVIRSKVKCMSFNLCVHRRVDWPKSRSPEVKWGRSSPRGIGGTRSTTPEQELVVKESLKSLK
jgi:hypothetical protein